MATRICEETHLAYLIQKAVFLSLQVVPVPPSVSHDGHGVVGQRGPITIFLMVKPLFLIVSQLNLSLCLWSTPRTSLFSAGVFGRISIYPTGVDGLKTLLSTDVDGHLIVSPGVDVIKSYFLLMLMVI